jgi:hypothetical protein
MSAKQIIDEYLNGEGDAGELIDILNRAGFVIATKSDLGEECLDLQPEDRFFYQRLHDHRLGWGVRDRKQDLLVAFGDKGMCLVLAQNLNGRACNLLIKHAGNYGMPQGVEG